MLQLNYAMLQSSITTCESTTHVTSELYYATFPTLHLLGLLKMLQLNFTVIAELNHATFPTLHLLGLLKMLQLNYSMLQSPLSTCWDY